MTKPYHIKIGLTDNDVLEMYSYMVLARKLHFVVSRQGQEATQIGAGFALDLTKDYIAPYYRDLGLVLVADMTSQEAMLHLFAKAEDPNTGGRQMAGHYGHKEKRIITG